MTAIQINTTKPNHFITTGDYTAEQLFDLVDRAIKFKVESKYNYPKARTERPLTGKTVGLLFSKRSTRTRVATETAIGYLGKINHSSYLLDLDLFFFDISHFRWQCYVLGRSRYSTWCE